MKLKNFIEVNVISGTYASKPYFSQHVNINNINSFKSKYILLVDGTELHVGENSEQIQQKIFECQNVVFLDPRDYTPIMKTEHNVVIKEYDNPDTELNVNEF